MNVKLTDASVRAIRKTYTNGTKTQYQLGRKFGVSQQHISRLVNFVQRSDV